MSTIKRPRRGEATRAYACQSCTKISRKMDNVDELVESVLLGYLDQERNRVPLIRKDTDDGGSLQDLLDEQRGLEARQNELATMFAEGHLTAAQLRAGTAKLEAKVDNLNKKIRQAREANPLSVMLLAGDDLRTTWERLAPTQKSRIVDELMSVTIMPTRRGKFDPSAIRIEWKD